MSKKRIVLLAILITLILATVAMLLSSVFKKTEPSLAPEATLKSQPTVPEKIKIVESEEEVLEPLPADNKEAIEAEIKNVDQEINSALETELDDLTGIEEAL